MSIFFCYLWLFIILYKKQFIEIKYHNYKFEGKTACVIGRSDIVGKPLAQMLIDQDCTVTVCHSKTEEDDLRENMYWSDIVFTCTNQIGYYDETYFGCR